MNYYYLVTGLPELTLDDSKLSITSADFKVDVYPLLNAADRKLVDLFYLQYDNANLLRILKDKEADIDPRGNYSAEELLERVAQVRGGEKIPDGCFPAYLSQFIGERLQAPDTESVAQENRLATLYYAYAMKANNAFVASWFGFNLTVNNVMVALSARKYKMEVAPLIVGETDVCQALRTSNARDFGLASDVDCLDTLMKIAEVEELADREKRLDRLRWEWMTNATFFNYFSVEKLFVFLLQIDMIERWLRLDKETGQQLFRSMVDGLKNEVQIPAEFR